MFNISSFCLTPACLHIASLILSNLAPDFQQIDPCTDFEQFVCKGFRQQNEENLETVVNIGNQNKRLLKGLLTSTYESSMNHSSGTANSFNGSSSSADEINFDFLQKSYLACMDEATLQETDTTPLRAFITDFVEILDFGDVNSVLEFKDYENLSKAIVFLEQRGVSTFEDISARTNPLNPNTTEIFVGPILPATSSTDPGVIASILQSVFYQNVSEPAARSMAQSVVDLETAFQNAFPSSEDLTMDRIYNYNNLVELSRLAPSLNLGAVIQQLAPQQHVVKQVILVSPAYLGNVAEIVAKTKKLSLQNWLMWRTILSFANDVESPVLKPLKAITQTVSRSNTCFIHVDQTLTWMLSRLYISTAFAERDRQFVERMMRDIRTQFIRRIGNKTWIPDDIKKLIAQKVLNIEQSIGYSTTSPNITDPASITKYYSRLNITDKHFENVVSTRRIKKINMFATITDPLSRKVFPDGLYEANAAYEAQGNKIFVNAGIMRAPVFSADVPAYISYGALGATLGHELTHGFDNNGRLYDPSGAYKSWWDNGTTRAFDSRAQCFIDQYNNYTVPGFNPPIKVDGQLTLSENLADAGGLNIAYDTWKSMYGRGQDLNLLGLDTFSQDQLFYISFGNSWCNSYTDKFLRDQVEHDSHSPSSVRLMGTVANSKGFKEAFSCPTKEPTCEIW